MLAVESKNAVTISILLIVNNDEYTINVSGKLLLFITVVKLWERNRSKICLGLYIENSEIHWKLHKRSE